MLSQVEPLIFILIRKNIVKSCLNIFLVIKNESEEFIFDACYTDYSAEMLFNTYIKMHIQNCVINGRSFTTFVYGQSGSGKTYLIFGKKDSNGILHLCIKYFFSDELAAFKIDYRIKITQFYDGKVLNMLDKEDSLKLPSFSKGLDIINNALKKRINNNTDLNTESSRSAALIIIVYYKNGEEIGRFNFIDLFGSEDISKAKDESKYSY